MEICLYSSPLWPESETQKMWKSGTIFNYFWNFCFSNLTHSVYTERSNFYYTIIYGLSYKYFGFGVHGGTNVFGQKLVVLFFANVQMQNLHRA